MRRKHNVYSHRRLVHAGRAPRGGFGMADAEDVTNCRDSVKCLYDKKLRAWNYDCWQ